MARLLPFLWLALAACSTTVNLRHINSGSEPFKSLKGKSVAIVDDSSRMSDNFSGTSEGHSYSFKEARTGVLQALKSRLSLSAKRVEVVQTASAKGDFDLIVTPELKIRPVSDFFVKGCLVDYRLEVINKAGRTIVSDHEEYKRTFRTHYDAPSGCTFALSKAFGILTDRVFEKIP